MRKSFRWHLFVRIFIATALILLANRMIAQYMTSAHLSAHIEQNIAGTLDRCRHDTASQAAFLLCSLKVNRNDALGNLSEFLTLCPTSGANGAPGTEPHCAALAGVNFSQSDTARELSDQVRLLHRTTDGEDWRVFFLAEDPDGPRVLVNEADIAQYINSIFNLRNRIVSYLTPVIVVMLMLLTVYMTMTVMRPIRQLEKSLDSLSSRNLDQPIDVLPPYREFARFLTVFEQLRERLSLSFLQARRFAADASHELRTPLTILRGNSERLIAELPTGSESQVRMRLIGDEIERLIEITEKLLLLSRADVNSIRCDMVPVDLSTLVAEMSADVLSFYPDVDVTSEVEPGVVAICDQSLIQQLLYNLFTNAAKYNAARSWIRFSLKQRDNRFVFTLENACDNIPADLAERAFQRFYRGDLARGRQVDGVGLGLSLCQEIARLHEAALSLQVNGSSSVVATLEGPLAEPAVEVMSEAVSA